MKPAIPTLAYRDQGSGQSVVLLHGVPSSSAYWAPVMQRLRANHRVVALDLLGFGASPRSATDDYSLQSHLESVVQTLHAIDLPAPWVVVGHSFGSLLAVQLADTHPELVDRLVLVSLPVYDDSAQVVRQLGRARFSPRYALDGIRAWFQTAVAERGMATRQARRPQPPARVSPQTGSINQLIADQSARRQLPHLRTKTVVLNGHVDALLLGVPYGWLEQLAHVHVRWLPGGHQLPLDHPAAVVAAVTD